jgi:glycosyltransferase involved in cell wall biosynthesis
MSAVMPTKIAEFLAVGRPVLINKGLGDYDHLIRSYKAGVVVDTDTDCLDERSLELITLLEDPDTSRRCRQLAEDFFDSRDAVDKYIQLYRAISPTSIH